MWFLFALSAAILDAIMDVIGKKGLENTNFAPYTVSWGLAFFGAFFLFPFVCFWGIPHIDNYIFWIALISGGVLNVFAFGNYFTAIKIADLSLVAPLTCLTPMFLLIISPLLLFLSGHDISNELPSLSGILGVLLIFVGSYVLNIDESQEDFFKPLKSMFIEPGLKKGVLAAFLWSITMSCSKVGINTMTSESDFHKAMFWGFLLMFSISIFILPFVFKEIKENKKNTESEIKENTEIDFKQRWQNWRFLISIGFINGLLMFSQMFALSLIVAAYAIAVKRLGNIFKVILGAFLFKEENFRERIAASSIMVIGVIFITLSNVIPNLIAFLKFWQNAQGL